MRLRSQQKGYLSLELRAAKVRGLFLEIPLADYKKRKREANAVPSAANVIASISRRRGLFEPDFTPTTIVVIAPTTIVAI